MGAWHVPDGAPERGVSFTREEKGQAVPPARNPPEAGPRSGVV